MTWAPSDIAGLTYLGQVGFVYRTNIVALSGDGRYSSGPPDPMVDAHFSYDDTAWGQIPEGAFARLATCAVNRGGVPFSAKYVQLRLEFLDWLGRDLPSPGSSGSQGGTLSTFHASMGGFGALQCGYVGAASGPDFSAALPMSAASNGNVNSDVLYLMRPTALHWTGQDDNLAVRTIWLQSEVGVVSFDFTVHSQSAQLSPSFKALGWSDGSGASPPPPVPSTVAAGSAASGLVRLPV